MTVARAWRVFTKGSLALLSVWNSPVGQAAKDGLEKMKALVQERFPEVKHLTTAELAAWLNNTKRVQPEIIDVRTRAEFEVSHLAGARWVAPDTSARELLPSLPTNRPVVLYCSIGYRSSNCATRLLRAGFAQVLNLEGSLFQWANEGRPLVRDGGVATQVHPYSESFGKLLKPELRAPITEKAR
ncbi:MAG TPA: rhodanese-like domain-containing protein [Verrucomicrobiota bacterium]|nr:sulfurtransferase [Verrucomicrobiales bacterium]HRI12709.1 rhodanese-like domain-containing protein [Verrucomicrobiota bacterium]